MSARNAVGAANYHACDPCACLFTRSKSQFGLASPHTASFTHLCAYITAQSWMNRVYPKKAKKYTITLACENCYGPVKQKNYNSKNTIFTIVRAHMSQKM